MNHLSDLEDLSIGSGMLPHPCAIPFDEQYMADLLDIEQLVLSYRFGFFPWYEVDNYAVFFHPKMRYIIEPSKIKIPKSMRVYFNKSKYYITIDQDFDTIIAHCKDVKRNQEASTWISNKFVLAYTQLYKLGFAHSVEVWDGSSHELVGGLYGVSFGKIFHGESMFSLKPNASRFGLIALSKLLTEHGFLMIDCQVKNDYLTTFGGEEIDRQTFFNHIKQNLLCDTLMGNWGDIFHKNKHGSIS